ncbi:DUF3278 domain-containing protein [Streptococcus suis]|uniref:DUF3278 domain-containing protein n=1 Tax=Streptococcus suis TaxID=1307 RepID=UPI0015532C1A|nr:DUF3278 domain-containing protein [Streptococcus suis]HEM4293357.1 DUF3278 domain-containing protein [Streptococcus suis]
MKDIFTKILNQATKDFYSISGPMDEMRQQESYRFSNTIVMIVFPILVIGNTIALLIALRQPEKVGFLLPLTNILIIGFTQALASHLALKNGISQSYEDEIDVTKLNKSLVKSSRSTFFGAFLASTTAPAFYQEWSVFLEELTDPILLLGRLIVAGAITFIHYYYCKKQLQKKILANK